MIPQGGIDSSQELDTQQQPSRTYRLDPVHNQIAGTVDGLEAVKQTVFKILQTERFEHSIYSGNYGSELVAAAGKDSTFIKSRLSRIIQEALKQDDRISDVQNIQITITGDEALVTFTVVSLFGSFQARKEV